MIPPHGTDTRLHSWTFRWAGAVALAARPLAGQGGDPAGRGGGAAVAA